MFNPTLCARVTEHITAETAVVTSHKHYTHGGMCTNQRKSTKREKRHARVRTDGRTDGQTDLDYKIPTNYACTGIVLKRVGTRAHASSGSSIIIISILQQPGRGGVSWMAKPEKFARQFVHCEARLS